MTPADELRIAAIKLREHVDAAEKKRPGPWAPGAAGTVISPREGGVRIVSGYTIPEGPEIARYIGLMDPMVGHALVRLLDQAADALTGVDVDDDEPALAIARALNGGTR
ncbi:hypothetical protein [Streptomyces roseolus]|uniref:hypothetical protein n=1 Tax=Streptomyces roseolus TaxID=67358 RepID=UPI0037AD4F0E